MYVNEKKLNEQISEFIQTCKELKRLERKKENLQKSLLEAYTNMRTNREGYAITNKFYFKPHAKLYKKFNEKEFKETNLELFETFKTLEINSIYFTASDFKEVK